MKEIKVLCKNDGSVQVSTTGYRGKACRQATAKLLSVLGADVQETVDTAEAALPVEREEGSRVEQQS